MTVYDEEGSRREIFVIQPNMYHRNSIAYGWKKCDCVKAHVWDGDIQGVMRVFPELFYTSYRDISIQIKIKNYNKQSLEIKGIPEDNVRYDIDVSLGNFILKNMGSGIFSVMCMDEFISLYTPTIITEKGVPEINLKTGATIKENK